MENMNKLVQPKFWAEILKLTLYYYVYILLTSKLKDLTVEKIKEKLKKDSNSLNGTYEGFIGKDLTIATTKILDDIHDFLDISPYMISSSCLTIRQYVGPSFNLNTVKALIKLRTDFKREDINDAMEQCKEVLDKYNETNKGDEDEMNYFKIIEDEIKRQAEEDKSLKNDKNAEKEEEPILIMENNEEDDDINEEVKNDNEGLTTFDINDFIDNEEEEDEKEETNYVELIKYEEEYKEVGQEEVSDIVYEGFMDKKTYRKWQTRYFQLKSGYLFWFKEKNSAIAQNKISMKNTLKVESHKDKKFLMLVSCAEGGDKSDDEDEKNLDFNGKVYKFSCASDEEKVNWVNAITNEMKRVKKAEEKRNYKLEIPIRKKVITDYFILPDIKDVNYMKKKVLEEMNREDYFKKNKRKMEMLQKKMQKEKEKEKQIQNENEKNNKNEQEVKESTNNDEGLTDKLKFWYNNKIGGFLDKFKKNI